MPIAGKNRDSNLLAGTYPNFCLLLTCHHEWEPS